MSLRPILHIPHASRVIPPDERAAFCLADAELERELTVVTDAFVDELFVLPELPHERIVYPVSRLVCDPERFADDAAEPMAVMGYGDVYERTSDGRPLRAALTPGGREALLRTYYEPHHRKVREAVAAGLEAGVLLLDLHSFASRPLPFEPSQDPNRPDICLGTHPLHTPPELLARVIAAFEEQGYRVRVNLPYGGVFVPSPFFGKDNRVVAIMIEVNRRLYMDEGTGAKNAVFSDCRARLEAACARFIRVPGV